MLYREQSNTFCCALYQHQANAYLALAGLLRHLAAEIGFAVDLDGAVRPRRKLVSGFAGIGALLEIVPEFKAGDGERQAVSYDSLAINPAMVLVLVDHRRGLTAERLAQI